MKLKESLEGQTSYPLRLIRTSEPWFALIISIQASFCDNFAKRTAEFFLTLSTLSEQMRMRGIISSLYSSARSGTYPMKAMMLEHALMYSVQSFVSIVRVKLALLELTKESKEARVKL